MPQIQVFQCPACGANLSYDGGPELSFPCQFCGTSVIVPESLRPQRAAPSSTPAAGGGLADMAQLAGGRLPLEKLAEMKRLAQSGQKIEAIRIYREVFGVGLREAKEAVEQLEAGHPLVLTSTSSGVSSNLTAEQAEQLADQVMHAALEGRTDEAARLAREMTSAGVPTSVRTTGTYAGAATPPRAPAAPRAKRGGGVWGCVFSSCLGVVILGIAGVAVFMSSGAPLAVSSIFSEATVVSSSIQSTRAAIATRVPNVTPTLSAPQVDATAGAKARSSQQAKSTAAAEATATRAAARAATVTAAAGATAEALETAAAQAQAEAAAQAVIAAQAAWPTAVSDKFGNNQLGWPTGSSDDDYFAITTTVKGKKFAWSFVPKRNAYANGFPLNPKAYTDFSATVKVKFVQGGEDGNTAVGLVFRHADQDYGFFGVDPAGNFRVNLAFPGSGIQDNQDVASKAIHTGAGQVNQLTVRGLGSDFVFQINDQVVWQFTQDLPKGDFGLGVDAKDQGEAVSVEFTDFEVHTPKK
jgi:ribosomal protein L7/L12